MIIPWGILSSPGWRDNTPDDRAAPGQAENSCPEEQMHRDECRWHHFNIKTSFDLFFVSEPAPDFLGTHFSGTCACAGHTNLLQKYLQLMPTFTERGSGKSHQDLLPESNILNASGVRWFVEKLRMNERLPVCHQIYLSVRSFVMSKWLCRELWAKIKSQAGWGWKGP